ncbi:erythrocyte membrane-associated antigen [Cryptosporidium ryanae]|uniref:erythrocyte membrane-associated antigen n=1 Tax=Cryptosporidium ryanae TaxID=515981 RepID=UPI00351A9AB8|nr:erythrocyte membrane-associated antigen [Cryptosporidium ryanae]
MNMNKIASNNCQDIGTYLRNMSVQKNNGFVEVNSISSEGYANNGNNTYFASSAYSGVINDKPSVCYARGEILSNNNVSSEVKPNQIRAYNTNNGNYDYYDCKDRITVENGIANNMGLSKALGAISGTGIAASSAGKFSETGFVMEPRLLTGQYAYKGKSSQVFDVSSVNNNTKISNSSWKEWNSYSKLLPLAVVELDVQNECNYLSNLFNSFSNTIKGFISSVEFEKLMDYVNIIEVGYRGTIFNVMDRNQDEYITEVEFLTGMLIFRPYNTKEKDAKNFNKLRLQFIFFYYDSNRDGLLSVEELAKLIEHISIIKVTINSDKTRRRTHLSSDKSRKLAKQIINDYLNKTYCSYDDFYLIVNNGVLNGTVNLLRCRNDIFIQKNNSSPIKLNNNTRDLKILNININSPNVNANNSHFQSPESFVNNLYNTPLSESVEQINKNDNNQSTKLSYISPYSNLYNSFNRSTDPYHNQNVGDHANLHNFNSNLSYSPNIYSTNTPNHTNTNSINNTVTRKNHNIMSPINNSLYTPTPDPLSNYRSTFGSSSPYYNIPSEGYANINMSPYYR